MAAWDPRSYLAEAASRHIQSLDTDACATTIVNYYESIASHLSSSEKHAKIEATLTKQRSQQLPQEEDGSREQNKEGVDDIIRVCIEGVQMHVPYQITVAIAVNKKEEHEDSTLRSQKHKSKEEGGEEKRIKNILQQRINPVFEKSRSIFSFEKNSEMMRINQLEVQEEGEKEKKGSTAMLISSEMAQVLSFAFYLHEQTEGKFDPTFSKLASIYTKALRESEAKVFFDFLDPSKSADSPLYDEFQKMSQKVGLTKCFRLVKIDDNERPVEELLEAKNQKTTEKEKTKNCNKEKPSSSAQKNKPVFKLEKYIDGATLDLCAISKGWVVDQLFEALVKRSADDDDDDDDVFFENVLINWGGDIKCIGHSGIRKQKEEGDDFEPWHLGLVQPPKLKLLFDAWQTGVQCEQQYMHCIEVPILEQTVTANPGRQNGADRKNTNEEKQHADGGKISTNARKGQGATMRGGGYAVATSGDYMQMEKFGHTHIFSPLKLRPLKVNNSTLSSVTIASTSCMLSDGIATALMCMERLNSALDLLPILRCQQQSEKSTASASTGCARYWQSIGLDEEEEEEEHEDESKILIEKFYFYERNNQNLVHDEDDLFPGENDQLRRVQHDKDRQKAQTLNLMHQSNLAAMSRAQQENMKAPQHSSPVLTSLQQLMSLMPRQVVIVTVPSSSYLEEKSAERSQSPTKNHKELNIEEAEGWEDEDVNAKEEVGHEGSASPVAEKQKKMNDVVKKNKKNQVAPLHAILLSSFCILQEGTMEESGNPEIFPASREEGESKEEGEDEEKMIISFNVMRGSILYNYVRCMDSSFVINFLRVENEENKKSTRTHPKNNQEEEKREEKALLGSSSKQNAAACHACFLKDNIAEWMANFSEDLVDLTEEVCSPLPSYAGMRLLTVKSLQPSAIVFRSTLVQETGDHILVVAKEMKRNRGGRKTKTMKTVDSAIVSSSSYSCLTSFHSHFGFPRCPHPNSNPVASRPLSNQPLATGIPHVPAVCIAVHREHGRIGFPVLNLQLCSAQPVMISFQAFFSVASKAFVDPSLLASPSFTIYILNSEKDHFPDGDYQYLPFPAFKEIPNVLATIQADLVQVLPHFNPHRDDKGELKDRSPILITAFVRGVKFLDSPKVQATNLLEGSLKRDEGVVDVEVLLKVGAVQCLQVGLVSID